MQISKVLLGSALVAMTTIAVAQVDISARRHPDLNAAQRDITSAIGHMNDAQRAHDYDLNGHATHAKELLEQADQEVKAAAVTANRR
jgi:hypothetical protein